MLHVELCSDETIKTLILHSYQYSCWSFADFNLIKELVLNHQKPAE